MIKIFNNKKIIREIRNNNNKIYMINIKNDQILQENKNNKNILILIKNKRFFKEINRIKLIT